MKRPAFVALLLLSFATVGCYSHAPVGIADVRPGTAVRVRLSAAEAERLQSQGQIQERVFHARVLESDPSSLLLRVPVATSQRVGGQLYNRISLTPEQMVELEVRKLDRARTAAAAGIGAVVVAAAAYGVFKAVDDPEGNEKEPGEPSRSVISIPFLGWAFR